MSQAIHIHTKSAKAAWRQTLLRLLALSDTDNQTYFRDEMVLIEIEAPQLEQSDPLFPMAQSDLDTINRFIVSGENEAQVVHEWTKLYFHRLFDEPASQIEYILSKLSGNEPRSETIMSLWDKTIDQKAEISPCTLVIWARKKNNRLELHVHAHSSDAYKKLLMNLQEFIALHHYLAARLNIAVGKYCHVIDSCHIHRQDTDVSFALARTIQSQAEQD